MMDSCCGQEPVLAATGMAVLCGGRLGGARAVAGVSGGGACGAGCGLGWAGGGKAASPLRPNHQLAPPISARAATPARAREILRCRTGAGAADALARPPRITAARRCQCAFRGVSQASIQWA